MSDTLHNALSSRVRGEVYTDTFTRKIYSIDASIHQIEPQAVICPRDADDVVAAVEVARSEGVPVVARGAATGLAGGCIGTGIVIDVSRHMKGIGEINTDAGYVVCGPGVVQDHLNTALAPHGYRLGPDTATSNRATLGGMAANNSSGAHSLRYGKMVDHLQEVTLVLGSGKMITFGELDDRAVAERLKQDGHEGDIYRWVQKVRDNLVDEIHERYPKIQRRVAGYNLDELIKPGPLNLARLIAGSEGTLGVITEMRVRIVPIPACLGLAILPVPDIMAGLDAVPALLEVDPYALEVIDKTVLELGQQSPVFKGGLTWLTGTPDGLLLVEVDGNERECSDKLDAIKAIAHERFPGMDVTVMTEPEAMAEVWTLRKAGLGLLMGKRSHERAAAFLEDVAVPPAELSNFMREFFACIKDKGKKAGMYGHAGAGCVHVRPMMDLRDDADIRLMIDMMEEVSDMVLRYGGAISGEHGDGIIRSWLIEKMFGPKITEAFREGKAVFDPDNLMNPGKIVDPLRPERHLRRRPMPDGHCPEPVLDFQPEGGLSFAVDMCNGNGQCLQTDSGTMCPSFQATGFEYHSTRARARSLQAIVNGEVDIAELTGPGLKDVMDLCLECKACKAECPSQVDMAKIKAELLCGYHKVHGVPLRSRMFAAVNTIGCVGSALAPLSNRIAAAAPGKKILSWLGLAPERELPAFTSERFSHWWRRRPPKNAGKEKVALLIDTYTEFHVPEIGRAAVYAMETLGYQVEAVKPTCCRRPAISKGLLSQARAGASKLVERLAPYAAGGIRIVGLEPSCILTIKDDYPSLIPGGKTTAVAAACTTVDEWLCEALGECVATIQWGAVPARVLVHGHCHQKALVGNQPTIDALAAMPGTQVEIINSGCCGMAGSFGYEKEHYRFSMDVAETRLFPAIRAAEEDTVLVANGISCRSQIEHGLGRKALHMVQVLADAMEVE